MRRWRISFLSIIALVAVLGASMIGLHGFGFFVFRNAGTGQTDSSALSENQGPGQALQPVTMEAHAPGGKLVAIHTVLSEEPSWATVAERDWHWTVVKSGDSAQAVVRLTNAVWGAQSHKYQSLWYLVPVTGG
jgi:hypothetical protein